MKGLPASFGGGETLEIELKDICGNFTAYLTYTVFEKSPILARSARFVNTSDKPIKIHALDDETILRLIDFGTTERAMIHLLTLKNSIAREVDIQHMNDFGMGVYFDMFNRICLRVDDLKQYVCENPGEVVKVNLYHRDRASRDRNLARMSKLNLSISYAESNNLEASPAGITKASGLIELCKFLNVDISETVAVGDGFNDKEILQAAGFAVAMGNARDKIKQLADFVTFDNDNDGVAAVIEKFF